MGFRAHVDDRRPTRQPLDSRNTDPAQFRLAQPDLESDRQIPQQRNPCLCVVNRSIFGTPSELDGVQRHCRRSLIQEVPLVVPSPKSPDRRRVRSSRISGASDEATSSRSLQRWLRPIFKTLLGRTMAAKATLSVWARVMTRPAENVIGPGTQTSSIFAGTATVTPGRNAPPVLAVNVARSPAYPAYAESETSTDKLRAIVGALAQ